MENISTPLLVVAVALVRHDGHILMHQRHHSRVHGGLWEFPGGKIEPGETPEHAAVRELSEELGVSLNPGDLSPAGFASGWTADAAGRGGRGRPLVILLYAARRWEGVPELREGAGMEWVAPQAIASLDMPELDYPLARALIGFLGLSANSQG